MVRKRPKQPAVRSGSENVPLASNVGAVLLDLHKALRQAERCRVTLRQLGYSQKRWLEIVKDVNPELRFFLHPQVLDTIITHLQSVGKPVNRKSLALTLHSQGAGPLQRIRQSITTNLRSGNLALYSRNRVGLSTWKSGRK